MCQFNLLIIDKKANSDNLKRTIVDIGFGYRELENENLRSQVGADKRIILTTKGHCDCGSVIGINYQASSLKIDIEKKRKKLRKRKWSESKIERYLTDHLRTQSKKEETSELGNESETHKWLTVIRILIKSEKKIGILFHQFNGLIEMEEIGIEQINKIPMGLLNKESLMNFKENELNWIKGKCNY